MPFSEQCLVLCLLQCILQLKTQFTIVNRVAADCICALQGDQKLAPECAVGTSQAVAPCASPMLDSPCPGQLSARESVASPEGPESLTTQNASLLPPDAARANCTSNLVTVVPSQGEQASATLGKRRPASAATYNTLRRPARNLSGTFPPPQAPPAGNSQAGQRAQHDSLISPQDAQLQSASHSTAEAVESILGQHTLHRQPSQAAAVHAHPELGKATMLWSTLRRTLTLTQPPNMPLSQDRRPSPKASGRSAKFTLLRDQHMPGELLHQNSAFPSDIFMRHEAACAGPLSPQPGPAAAAAAQPGSPYSSLQRTRSAAEAQSAPLRGSTQRSKSPEATLLRDQHLPGELLHQKTAFPSDIYMRHEAACTPRLAEQPLCDTTSGSEATETGRRSTAGVPGQEQRQLQQAVHAEVSSSTMLRVGAVKQSTLPRTVSFVTSSMADGDTGTQAVNTLTSNTGLRLNSATTLTRPPKMQEAIAPRGTRNEASLRSSLMHSRHGDASQTAVASKLQRGGNKDASSEPKSSLKRADSRLKQSGQAAPATPRSLAGPWFEATTHDLTRSQTWAKEWLELEVQDDDPTTPEFLQLQEQQQLSQHDMEHQPPLLTQQHAAQQPTQQHTLQHSGQKHSEQNTSQQQPMDPTLHQAWQGPATQLLPSPDAAASSLQNQTFPPDATGTSVDTAEPDAHAMQQQTSSRQQSQCHGRPHTAPQAFWSLAADAPWAMDARRLHSARPGSGGSPTARYKARVPR